MNQEFAEDVQNNVLADAKQLNQEFAEDVRKGLSADPKHLPSKYFYDEQGSKLFQEIMQLNEYYLTNCEFEVLTKDKNSFFSLFSQSVDCFEMVEFGAGDGLKTKVLLEHFLQQEIDFRYLPVDISRDALEGLVQDLGNAFPDLQVEGVCDDYFNALEKLKLDSNTRKIVLFLGSNLGNFSPMEADKFLKTIADNLNSGDMLLIGLDLKKNPLTVLKAYNDTQGVTRAFNFNLLQRMNKELGANFDIDSFCHFPVYDPASGGAKSYIMSTQKQEVYIKKLDQAFEFEAWEAIHTETSHKYTPYMINRMAEKAGFEVVQNFYDHRDYFTNSVWRVK